MPYLFKVKTAFTIDPDYTPAPGQTLSFNVGQVIQVTDLHRTRGGFKTGIPYFGTDGNWHYEYVQSSWISIVTVCAIGDDSADYSECISPATSVIDNEAAAGSVATPPEELSSSGSTIAKVGITLAILYSLTH